MPGYRFVSDKSLLSEDVMNWHNGKLNVVITVPDKAISGNSRQAYEYWYVRIVRTVCQRMQQAVVFKFCLGSRAVEMCPKLDRRRRKMID